jgi:hypothetical protein
MHEVHMAPLEPHALDVVPFTQLVPSQHPPLHVRPPAQLVPHSPEDGSHASPVGQLAEDKQPESWPESWPESLLESLLESRPESVPE